MYRIARAFATSGVLAIAGCPPTEPQSVVIEERRLAPSAVNAGVRGWTDDHYLWLPVPLRATRVMLLLSGTNGRPSNNRLIGHVAAEQGYRVIGLMYPNDRAVVEVCASDPAADCMERVRAEIVEGIDRSPHVDVGHDDGIDGRLADLLRALAGNAPDEGWEEFLDATGAPRWDRIAVGGLSQGGGHAAFIAKQRSVPRVVMFGAPADGYSGQVAPWMHAGATPADRYHGFRHVRDPFRSIAPNWLALGLAAFGPEQSVDEDDDFAGSHMLVTDALPATGSYGHAHPSVFADGATPRRADGSPVFAAAWRYLLGRP